MKIIGVGGLKESGKDTLAKFLHEQARKTDDDCRIYYVAFADAIKRMLIPLGYPVEALWGPSEKREWVHPVLGISARVLLQRVGTEIARQLDPDFWVKAWGEVIDMLATNHYTYSPITGLYDLRWENKNEVIVLAADLRFENEYRELVKRNAYTVLVDRNLATNNVDVHLSERWCREDARNCVDMVVLNNDTLDDLKARSAVIYKAAMDHAAAV